MKLIALMLSAVLSVSAPSWGNNFAADYTNIGVLRGSFSYSQKDFTLSRGSLSISGSTDSYVETMDLTGSFSGKDSGNVNGSVSGNTSASISSVVYVYDSHEYLSKSDIPNLKTGHSVNCYDTDSGSTHSKTLGVSPSGYYIVSSSICYPAYPVPTYTLSMSGVSFSGSYSGTSSGSISGSGITHVPEISFSANGNEVSGAVSDFGFFSFHVPLTGIMPDATELSDFYVSIANAVNVYIDSRPNESIPFYYFLRFVGDVASPSYGISSNVNYSLDLRSLSKFEFAADSYSTSAMGSFPLVDPELYIYFIIPFPHDVDYVRVRVQNWNNSGIVFYHKNSDIDGLNAIYNFLGNNSQASASAGALDSATSGMGTVIQQADSLESQANSFGKSYTDNINYQDNISILATVASQSVMVGSMFSTFWQAMGIFRYVVSFGFALMLISIVIGLWGYHRDVQDYNRRQSVIEENRKKAAEARAPMYQYYRDLQNRKKRGR